MRLHTKLATAAAAGILALLTFRGDLPIQALPEPAQRFVSYYKALGASPAALGAWEKFLCSLALASAARETPSAPAGGAGSPPLNGRSTAF